MQKNIHSKANLFQNQITEVVSGLKNTLNCFPLFEFRFPFIQCMCSFLTESNYIFLAHVILCPLTILNYNWAYFSKKVCLSIISSNVSGAIQRSTLLSKTKDDIFQVRVNVVGTHILNIDVDILSILPRKHIHETVCLQLIHFIVKLIKLNID